MTHLSRDERQAFPHRVFLRRREKRDFVSKVAAILARRFGEASILYDKYHEAPFARSDLGIHLPDLYHKESDLVVLVICQDYESKEWCGLEWTAIHALIKERKVEDLMLCRFDHALIKGLYSTAGFVELDGKSPEAAAKLIIQRLESNGVDTTKRRRTATSVARTTGPTNTPNNLPRLHSFFGRADELRKIADALSPKTRTWGVLIEWSGWNGENIVGHSCCRTSAGGTVSTHFVPLIEREENDRRGGAITFRFRYPRLP